MAIQKNVSKKKEREYGTEAKNFRKGRKEKFKKGKKNSHK